MFLIAIGSLPLLSFPEVSSFCILALVHSPSHWPGELAAAVRSTCPSGVRWAVSWRNSSESPPSGPPSLKPQSQNQGEINRKTNLPPAPPPPPSLLICRNVGKYRWQIILTLRDSCSYHLALLLPAYDGFVSQLCSLNITS